MAQTVDGGVVGEMEKPSPTYTSTRAKYEDAFYLDTSTWRAHFQLKVRTWKS